MREVSIYENGVLLKRITVARRGQYMDVHVVEHTVHNGNYRLTSSSIKPILPNITETQFLENNYGIAE